LSYRGKSKGSYGNRSGRTISGVQHARSSRAKSLDAVLKAPLAKTDEQWMNNPSHYDWPNVDMPKPKDVVLPPVEKKPDELVDERFEAKRSKAEEYWMSLTPMQRYDIMKVLDLNGKSVPERLKKIMSYIEKNDLPNKKILEIKKLEPKIIEIAKIPVLVQPEIVKTNSIPEAIATRPDKAKTYAEGGQSFEVLESEFINRQIEKNKSRYNGNIKWCEEQISEIRKDPNLTERRKKSKIEELQFNIESSKRWSERLDKPESRAAYEHSAKEDYIKLIKASIKHGKSVPQEVVEQRPEFQVAQDARRRYEKGLHTSFANKSAAVNAVMFLEKGYKVKRQDGKPILDRQITEIDTGLNDIQTATGSSKDIMEKSDLTIAHTSGTYPFLDSAGGLYHPAEKTITMGILGIRALAHEWGHWLDHEAGKQTRDGHEFYTNGRTSRRIKSFREGLSKSEEYSNPLFKTAEYKMNNRWAIRELERSKREGKELPPEQAEMAKTMRGRIGTYWSDPREIFARLTEQYVAEFHGKPSEASESAEYYGTGNFSSGCFLCEKSSDNRRALRIFLVSSSSNNDSALARRVMSFLS
jgi:hypothetical protein